MGKHRKNPLTWAQRLAAALDRAAVRVGLLAFLGLAALGLVVSAPTGGVRDPNVPHSTTTYVVHAFDPVATLGVQVR